MKNRLFCLGLLPLAVCAREKQNPNIVFILADDLGYGDIACLNQEGKIPTPNLDRLASRGVVFTNAHSGSAVSTPTRYGILTGRYCWRSRLKNGVLVPYSRPLIESGRTTMAGMLRKQGYHTACVGKWHLGMNFPTTDGKAPVDRVERCNIDFSAPITGGPVDVGFDYYFGVDAPNYPPYCFIENRRTLGIPTEFVKADKMMDSRAGRGLPDWKMEDILPRLEQEAVEFIGRAASEKEPFFLCFPLPSPHTPIVPDKAWKGKSGMNLYADFVMQTDAVVGEIMKTIEEKGIAENTLIVFTSDNGCSPCAEYPVLAEHGHDPSYIFRRMKSDLYEGGHRVPCVVSWSGRLKPHRVDGVICLTDYMATFAALTDYQLVDNEAEDSYNIWPLLEKTWAHKAVREATVHHSINGSFALRKGKWKLLLASTSGGWSDPRKVVDGMGKYQLFDMEKIPPKNRILPRNICSW